jgi:hypothetical protein
MNNPFKLFIAGCWLLALAGCASSGMVKHVSQVSSSAAISRDFVLVETSSSITDGEPERRLLNALIISGLQETGKFGRVVGNKTAISPADGIKVGTEIKEIRKVSDAARLWTAGLTGQARILVLVTVADLKSGNQLASFEAEGKSSGGTTWAGTTDQAIQKAAEEVVDEVVRIVGISGK